MIFYLIFYFIVTSCLCLTDKNTNSAVWKSDASLEKMLKYLQEEESVITSASCISSASSSVTFRQDGSAHSSAHRLWVSRQIEPPRAPRAAVGNIQIKGFNSTLWLFHGLWTKLLFCSDWSFWQFVTHLGFFENKIKYTYIPCKILLPALIFEAVVNYLHRGWARVYVLSIRRRRWATSPRGGGRGGGGRGNERVSKWAENAAFSKGHHHPQALFPVFSSEAQDSRSLRMCSTYRSLAE